MEKSKAIELLKLAVPIKALTQQEYADFVEAVNMGMNALEQPTSPDTIDRKAALDALRKCQTYLYDALDPELKIKLSSAKAAINNLPTIQPKKAQLSQEGTTSDMISRQDVVDAIVQCTNCGDEDTLRGYVLKHNLDNGWTGGILEALDAVKDLPTVQPERTEGEWIVHLYKVGVSRYECDACHARCDIIYPYCPYCGEKKEGERDAIN